MRDPREPHDRRHRPVLISLLLPTRGRPRLAERFMASAIELATDPGRVEVVIYADDDDPGSHDLDGRGLRVRTLVGARMAMGACNSACLAASSGEILVLANDDVIIRTPGWDDRLRGAHAAVPDGVYLAYPNDLYKGRRLCSFPVLSRRLCGLLVDPFPALYRGAFIDQHLMDIFRRMRHSGLDRIRYLREVVFEHRHHLAGKAPMDETYRARDRFGDDAAYIALGMARQAAADFLVRSVNGQATEFRPPPAAVQVRPASLGQAMRHYANVFLSDGGLPPSVRLAHCLWFLGRHLASTGRLPWIVR